MNIDQISFLRVLPFSLENYIDHSKPEITHGMI